MKLKAKEEPEEIQAEMEAIDNKLELLKYTSQVQSRVKDEISSDFVLAKLTKKDKTGIIEMTSNAYFIKRLMQIIKLKARVWDYEDGKWIKRKLNKEEKDEQDRLTEITFDMFMNRIYMTVILNRNVEKNHLLRILAGIEAPEEEGEEEKTLAEGTEIKEKAKKVLKNREEEEDKK